MYEFAEKNYSKALEIRVHMPGEELNEFLGDCLFNLGLCNKYLNNGEKVHNYLRDFQ